MLKMFVFVDLKKKILKMVKHKDGGFENKQNKGKKIF